MVGGGGMNPWFKFYTEAVDDEKLRLLAFEDRWHFVALLCCKGKGILNEPNPNLKRRKMAIKLGLDPRTLDEVARRLAEVGLIDEETLEPLAWDQRQGLSDQDSTNAERQRRFRERKRENKHNADRNADRNATRNATRNGSTVTVTPIEVEVEVEVEAEREADGDEERRATAQAPRTAPPVSPVTAPEATSPKPKAAKAPKPLKFPIPADWTPAETTYALLEKQGMDRRFAESCLDEFRLFWQEQGERRPGWEATFLNNVKRQWERRPIQTTTTPHNGKPGPFISKQDRIAVQNEAALAEWLSSRGPQVNVIEGECHEVH